MKIKAAVFDMDGLMFDTERLAMAAWDYAGEKMGLGKAGYMVMKTLGESPKDCIALEDSRNGLWAAHNAGCRVIMVPDLWQADEETENVLWKKFTNLLEVRNFLRGDE